MHAPLITVVIPTGEAVFIWCYHGAMPTIADFSANGYDVIIGSSGADYYRFTVHGKDTLPKGGWFNVAVDPLATPTLTVGTPTTTTNTFGSRCNQLLGVAKGNPYANDYVRYGRSIIVDDGEIANPGTFGAAATENDLVTNKWGLFESIAGGYGQKGLFQIGTVASLAYFKDSNVNIIIEDTLHVAAGFNEFEVLNAGSTVIWEGVQITALGTASKGKFTVTDNATVTKTGCTFNDMDAFVYQSNSTITGAVFRRCGQITQGGSTITSSSIDSSTAAIAMVVSDLTLMTGNTFVSDAVGHAVDLGTVAATDTVIWDNTLDDGAGTEWTGSAGTTVGVSGTANDAILVSVDSGQTLTISVAAGATIPTVRNTGLGTVTVSAGEVTLTITVKDINDSSLLENAMVYVTAAAGGSLAVGTPIIDKILTNVSGISLDTRSYATDQPVVGKVRLSSASPFYKNAPIAGTINNVSGLSLTIQMISDE